MQVFLPDFALQPSKTITMPPAKMQLKNHYRVHHSKLLNNRSRKAESSSCIRTRKSPSFQLSDSCNTTIEFSPFFSSESCTLADFSTPKKRKDYDFPIHSRKNSRFTSHILHRNSKKKTSNPSISPLPNKSFRKENSYIDSPFLVARKVIETDLDKRAFTQQNPRL